MGNISRRSILTAVAATALTGALASGRTEASPTFVKTWGDDFLTPWSPPDNLKKNLTVGPSSIRLSCTNYSLHYKKDMNMEESVKIVPDKGYTAAEGGEEWKDASDSEIKEFLDSVKKHNILFYALHMCINNIHPDMTKRQENLKRVAKLVETADRMNLSFVVTHTGSKADSPTSPHKDNWTKSAWDDSVKSMKQILKDTAGSKVNLAVEALNPCNINNPKAHVRLKQDVGDERIKVTLDPTNMLNPSDVYRTTELIQECFELIGEDIMYAHAKDVLWTPDMLPALKWVIPGEGSMDYETYLTSLSRLKYNRVLMLEFLSENQYPQAKKFVEDTAKKVGVKIVD